jgi:hypothetical protein
MGKIKILAISDRLSRTKRYYRFILQENELGIKGVFYLPVGAIPEPSVVMNVYLEIEDEDLNV